MATLKIIGCGDSRRIKVIKLKYNVPNTADFDFEHEFTNTKTLRGLNDEKMRESISRTKSTIYELAFCNSWDYFFTGTLDPKRYQRDDLKKFHEDLTQWLRNQGKKYGQKIDFLLIPERHSDGQSWHMHGFLRSVPEADLRQFRIGDQMSKALAEKVRNGDLVFNWVSYSEKFGFCDLEPIRNAEAVSKYVMKYICKDLARSVSDVGAHMFYHSRGLKTAEVIKKGTMSVNMAPSYENDYIAVYECDYSEEALNRLASMIT